MKIPGYIIERIRAIADILDVVSDYVRLKKSGRNYFGLCPFHQEKTPSFSVNPEKQIFHCFGCGKGGNVFTFLMEYEKLTFYEAVVRLAQRYNVRIEYQDEDKGERELITLLYEIHRIVKQLYIKNLETTEGETALEYLKSRGFITKTIKRFNIGYALNSSDQVYRFLKESGFSDNTIMKSGLVSRSDDGRIFDRFRHRIIFPIENRTGNTIAFAGRALSSDDPAKYLNSPETEIYSKSNVLFGLTQASEAIRKANAAIVVEGYTDLMKLHQSGVENVVACSGTAFTTGHARILSRIAGTVYLCYDGDEAGQKAAVRAGMILLKQGIQVKNIKLPLEHDPDSFLTELGVEQFRKLIDQAIEYPEFMASYHRERLKTPREKSNFVQEIALDLADVQDSIIRSDIIKQLSTVLQIDEQAIISVLRKKWKRQKSAQSIQTAEMPGAVSAYERAEEDLLKLLLVAPQDVRLFIWKNVKPELIQNKLLRKIVDLYSQEKGEINIHSLIEETSEEKERNILSRYLVDDKLPEYPMQLARDCLISMENRVLNGKIEELRLKLMEAEKNDQDTIPILQEISSLMKKRSDIQSYYNSLIEKEKVE